MDGTSEPRYKAKDKPPQGERAHEVPDVEFIQVLCAGELEVDVDDAPRLVPRLMIEVARSRTATAEKENVVAALGDVYVLTTLVIERDGG